LQAQQTRDFCRIRDLPSAAARDFTGAIATIFVTKGDERGLSI
jgi:hypothetical protein